MRKFNIFGTCFSDRHYMVDISDRVKKINEIVKSGEYFVISRPRQYGKTTTLNCLEQILDDEYIVISISFQGMGDKSFESEENFCLSFMELVKKSLNSANIPMEYKEAWFNKEVISFIKLNLHIDNMCKNQKVVLIVDEVDKASNNRVFLEFLDLLRAKYLASGKGKDFTFHSIILAGVYDIKNIKLKMIKEGLYSPLTSEERMHNSPWNIAADLETDMSFNPKDIETMLKDYLSENDIPLDINMVSQEIYKYTSGYPFLVSNICKIIDEKLDKNWTQESILEAVKIIVTGKNTLSDYLLKNLESYKDLYDFLYSILIVGTYKSFNIDDPIIKLGNMFGYIKREDGNGKAIISNKIFEIRISNYFISKDSNISDLNEKIDGSLYQDIVKNNSFNMELCLIKFAEHYKEIYNKFDVSFFEKHGRLLFLSFLKPLINGKGFYHIESQFTDYRRMDIVVDYSREQFIIELKIWDGEASKEKAYEQLLGYMNTKNADRGYLLIFNFRKSKNNEQRQEWTQIGDKKIFSVII